MSLDHSPRKLVTIGKAAPYIGARGRSSTYDLIHSDPEFAKLWFSVGKNRVVAYEDMLVAYLERRAETARRFVPAPTVKRGRGRPRKVVVEAADVRAS